MPEKGSMVGQLFTHIQSSRAIIGARLSCQTHFRRTIPDFLVQLHLKRHKLVLTQSTQTLTVPLACRVKSQIHLIFLAVFFASTKFFHCCVIALSRFTKNRNLISSNRITILYDKVSGSRPVSALKADVYPRGPRRYGSARDCVSVLPISNR